jgi:hypothetical protein
VTALEIIAFLDANSGGLHAVDMISLRTNMHQYYVQSDSIPQYINMLEDAQKKAKQAGMPIADIELVMMASAAVLAAQHFPRKVDDWEGLPSSSCTWLAWKTAFRLAHLKRQRQILASGGGKPLGGAHGVLPAAAPEISRLESALNNLALVATNDTAVPLSPRSPRPTKNWWMRRLGQGELPWRLRRWGGGVRPGTPGRWWGMANVVYENSNDFCKNNYYYALASSYNPSQLPSSDTGIADSSSNGF